MTSVSWNPPAGSATVGSGSLTVDGVRVHPPNATQTAPEVLEFRATFANSALQHVGFGDTLEGAPWAIFSTGGGGTGLSARTRVAAAQPIDEPIAIDPLVPHVYRIEWAPNEVRYLVDDALVATHAIAIATQMRPIVSDFAAGSGEVKIDWLGVGAYSSPGVYESRVHDAGDVRAVWGGLTAMVTGGTADVETRSGSVPTPDGTWSGWEPLSASGAIASPIGRYIQYRATLGLAGDLSPSLERVEIAYDVDNILPIAAIDGVDVAGNTATLRFSSADQDVARFECRLGTAATFVACTSPHQFAGLASGFHTVFVRAVDRAGNVGPGR